MTIFADGFDRYSNCFCRRMKRRIIILRHAQSAGKQANQTDYERSLTLEGERAANNLGAMMLQQSIKPDYLLSSSAVRAKMTADIAIKSLGVSPSRVQYLKELYEASTDVWVHQLQQLPDDAASPLLVGHNPVLSQLVSLLEGRLVDLAPAAFFTCEINLDSWKDFPSKGEELKEILNTR